MKYLVAVVVIVLGFWLTAGAQVVRVFTSEQVGTNPVNGYCLTTNGATSTWAPCGSGSGTPGGGNGQLQFNNGGSFGGTSTPSVTAINATNTSATSTLPNIIAQKIQSFTSAGLTFFSNGGSPVADFGAGGGSNASFFGGVNIDGQTRLATSLTGLLKGTSGVVSVATPGTDYVANTTGDWTGTFDGQEGTFYLSRANHTGTQLASTISDFTTQVQALSVGTTSAGTTGSLAFWTGARTLGNVATGTLTETATGLSLSGTPAVIGGSSVLTIDAGFALASTTGLSNLYTFYDTPSNRITAGTGLSWSGNTLNGQPLGFASSSPFTTGDLVFASNAGRLNTVATGTLTENVSGLEFSATRALVGGAAILNLTSGFVIPTSTLWTQVADFYTTPSTRITAGSNCSWAGNTFNCTGGSGTLGTTSALTTGQVLFATGASTTASRATTTLVAGTGITFSGGTPIIIGSSPITIESTGGGGGGGLSTTTDIVGDGAASTVSYVTTDVMFGGSASTSAEFLFDKDGAKLIIASSSDIATSTFANTNTAQAVQFGVASTSGSALVRGVHFNFSSTTRALVSAMGTVLDWVFDMPVYLLSALKDVTGSAGTSGMVLTSTGTSTRWVATSSLGISGAASSFTVGPTSTPMWRSTLQGWTFPDGSLVNTDIQANRFHTIKPIWYEVTATGSLFLRIASSTQPFGFNATNTEIIKENSIEQFVTVSGNPPEIHTLTASSTLVNNSIDTLVGFATSTGFTGIELDWEGFGTWTATETQQYINYVEKLSVRAKQVGLKTMIYLPPIWNSVANGESGSGDQWDTAVSENYYQLEYEDFENIPVDYLVIAVYDYQFDYGAGTPNAPLKWQDEIISYAKRKISDHSRLVIGIPSAGYFGATGGFTITGLTYASATAITGFSGATRDAASGELTWTNAGNSYFVCDDECVNIKRLRAEEQGITRVTLWHIGGNRYGSGRIEPTIQAAPQTTLQDMLVGERWRITCSHIVGAVQIAADGLTGCEGVSFYEDATDGTLTATVGNGYSFGRVAAGATTNSGSGVFINGPSAGWIRIASSTSAFSAIARQSSGTLYGTSTALYIGFTNVATAGTTYETAPTAGCYFTSSSTQANVWAVSANNSARTNTNTQIASSTSNSAGQFYEYRVVPYPTGCRFLMRTSQNGTLREVAYHTTNLPLTIDLNAGVHIGRGAATLNPTFDLLSMDYEAAILLPLN